MKKISFLFLGFFVCFVLVSFVAKATTNRFDVTRFPANLSSDYATVLGSDTLGKGFVGIFLKNEYNYRPLEINVGGARAQGVVDQLFVNHLSLSYGLFDFVDVELTGTLVPYNRFQTPNTPAPGFSNETDLGDVLLRTRFRLADKNKHIFGLSIIPFVTAPVGNATDFVGETTAKGGVTVAVERQFNSKFSMGLNLGAVIREAVQILDYNTKTLLNSGLGAKMQWTKNFSTSLDVVSQTTYNRPYQDHVTSPVEVAGAAQYVLGDSGFALKAGGGTFFTKAAGTPEIAANLALSFQKPLKAHKAKLIKRSIYFDFDRHALTAAAVKTLNEVEAIYRAHRGVRLIINQGYADIIGDQAYNKKLAYDRAYAVKNHLVTKFKIPADKITIEAVGALPGLGESERQHNRRVDIEIRVNR